MAKPTFRGWGFASLFVFAAMVPIKQGWAQQSNDLAFQAGQDLALAEDSFPLLEAFVPVASADSETQSACASSDEGETLSPEEFPELSPFGGAVCLSPDANGQEPPVPMASLGLVATTTQFVTAAVSKAGDACVPAGGVPAGKECILVHSRGSRSPLVCHCFKPRKPPIDTGRSWPFPSNPTNRW